MRAWARMQGGIVAVVAVVVVLAGCQRDRAPQTVPTSARGAERVVAGPPARVLLQEVEVRQREPSAGDLAVTVAKPELDRLVDPDRVVFRAPRAVLLIDYPLEHPARRPLVAPGKDGTFTVISLVREIAKAYREIYDEEARTTSTPVGKIPGMLNRNATNGKYGISMHDIDDLALTTIRCHLDAAGDVIVEVEVDS